MYNSCKIGDSVAIILKDSSIIKGKVTKVEKVINKREQIISFDSNTYIKHSSNLNVSDGYKEFKITSSGIMCISIL